MKKNLPYKTIAAALGGVLVVYALLGFFAVPAVMDNALDSAIRQHLSGTYSAQSVSFNPFTLAARIRGLDIAAGQKGPGLSAQSIYVNLSAASLFRLAPVISQLTVEAPKLNFSLDQTGMPILPVDSGKSESEETGSDSVFGFSISNLTLVRGQVDIEDTRFQTTHHINELAVDIPRISALGSDKEMPVKAVASFSLNQAPVKIDFSGKLFQPDIELTAKIMASHIALSTWLSYIPLPEKISLSPSAELSWDLIFGLTGKGPGQDGGSGISIQGTAGLTDFNLDLEGQGPVCRLPGLTLAIDTPDLLARGVHLTLVRLDRPEVFLVRQASGTLPLIELFQTDETVDATRQDPGKMAEPGQAGKDADAKIKNTPGLEPRNDQPQSMPLILDRFECKEGQVHFKDDAVEGGFSLLAAPVSIDLKNVMIQGGTVDLSAAGRIMTSAGETLSLSGQVSLAHGITRVQGELALENGSPPAYTAYLRQILGPGPQLDRLNARGDFSLTLGNDGIGGGVTNARLDLSGLGLKDVGNNPPLVHVPRFEVDGIDVDLTDRILRFGSVQTAKGEVNLRINGQGQMNLFEQLQSVPAGAPAPAASASDTAHPSWQVSVDQLGIADWHLNFHDQSRQQEPVNIALSDIRVTADGLTTERGRAPGKIKAAMAVQDKGRMTLAGPIDLAGRTTRLDIGLDKIDIPSFQPYVNDYLNIEIPGGWAGAKADLAVAFPDGKPLRIRIRGEAGIGELSTKDKVTHTDFFTCKSLFVSGMDISLNPTSIQIKDISLTDFYNRAVITESGQLNYRLVLPGQNSGQNSGVDSGQKDTHGKPLSKQKAGLSQNPSTARGDDSLETADSLSFPIDINHITLQGGQIDFTDLFTRPSYTAKMTQIGGSVSGLSTTAADPAEVVLKGVHGLHSPLDITGKLIPFGPGRMADMSLSFKNIDLTQFNAYAQKYLGYGIETGKLVLNLDYQIRGNSLASKNRLFFDQFDLGKRVESPDATSLPVELAISLLKNSKNQIDLDIPVSGNLNDPQFSFAQVTAVAFKNLILSVVSAPFKLLGKMIGGWSADELGYVAFAPGGDQLDDNSMEKLKSLAEVLSRKERLKFVIAGRYDPDLDAQTLRVEKYHASILNAAGKVSEAKQQMLIERLDQRETLVEKLYKEAAFPKPRDESGHEKKIQPAEQEKLLVTNTEVTPQELSQLADHRSNGIMSFLADQGIDPQRLFIQAPEAVNEADRDGRVVKTVFKVE